MSNSCKVPNPLSIGSRPPGLERTNRIGEASVVQYQLPFRNSLIDLSLSLSLSLSLARISSSCWLWMEDQNNFDPDLIHAIFKLVWTRRALEREKSDSAVVLDLQAGARASKKNRPTYANANALKLSCELLRTFIIEAVERAATIAEAEGVSKIEATHLERILPQLLLDF